MAKQVLVVDDEASVREALKDVLEDAGYSVVLADNGRAAIEKMEALNPSAVLMDIRMPKLDGLEALELIKQQGNRVPIILITAYGNTETTIRAMKLGAFDYINKPFKLDELLLIVEKAVKMQEMLATMGKPPEGYLGELDEEIMVGRSPAMQSVYKAIGRIVDSNVTVLIRGESGTGKELVAKAIHLNSPRKDKPFIKLNCASIPDPLLESELLGYEKGAFTGAAGRKPGKFELADRGTIFLDEIGEMSMATQSKLLRLIQEKEFERVGGTETIKVDVRIVAATNKNLEQCIQQGTFREDLFFRLNVVEIWAPPLRERKEDIPVLAGYLIKRCNREFGKEVSGFSAEAMKLLMQYNWPGNIRELKNVCERAVLMAVGPVINADEVPLTIYQHHEAFGLPAAKEGMSFKEIIADVERQVILNVLKEHNWNRSAAAATLKMSRSSLYAKMRELGIIGESSERGTT